MFSLFSHLPDLFPSTFTFLATRPDLDINTLPESSRHARRVDLWLVDNQKLLRNLGHTKMYIEVTWRGARRWARCHGARKSAVEFASQAHQETSV